MYHIYLRAARQSEPSGRNLTSWLVYFFVFQIYPDPDSEKAIMGSVVYCIHHKEGCKWTGELRKLKVRNIVINLLRGIYKRVFRNLSSTTTATSVDNINAYETYIDITESLSQTWPPPPFDLLNFKLRNCRLKQFFKKCRIEKITFLKKSRRVSPCASESTMRRRWQKDNAGREKRWSDDAATGQVPLCWRLDFDWAPLCKHTYFTTRVFNSDLRVTTVTCMSVASVNPSTEFRS